jgi:CRP-like cAMP-binding protein
MAHITLPADLPGHSRLDGVRAGDGSAAQRARDRKSLTLGVAPRWAAARRGKSPERSRALLLLARYGTQSRPVRIVPTISQETLAEMVGTTRSRVNFFLNKFRKLGFIEYDGKVPLKINSSLLSVVLHD